MKKYKVAFRVVSENKLLVDTGKFMLKMDLGIEGLTMPIYEKIRWETKTYPSKKYILKMKELLKQALISGGRIPIKITYKREE
mgnify:CR=1 FL=1